VGGYPLPKGTTVLVTPYLLQRDARTWDDPLTFLPERWLRPGGAPKKSEGTRGRETMREEEPMGRVVCSFE
jgi:cytochrome P450